MPTVAMTMVMEEEEADDVRCESERSYDKNKFWMRNFLRFDESLDRFEKYREAESDKEDTVDKSTQCFRALPLRQVSKAEPSTQAGPRTPYVYILEFVF